MESGVPHRIRDPVGDQITFAGHVLPGAVYFAFGCFMAFNTLFRYHVARRQAILLGSKAKKLCYKNALFSKYHYEWCRSVPVEAIVLAAGSTSGLLLEIVMYHDDLPMMEAVQHIIIYSFSALVGIVEILRYYKFPLPPSSEYAIFMVASAVTGFLFTNHLDSKELADRQMHLLLVYVCFLSILCAALELTYKRNVTVALSRILSLVVQGLWMCAIGIIAYPLPFMHVYDLNDHATMGYVTALFVVVVAVALMIAFAMNVIITMRVRNMNLATVNRILALMHHQHMPSGSKGEAGRPLISDSDYDM